MLSRYMDIQWTENLYPTPPPATWSSSRDYTLAITSDSQMLLKHSNIVFL